MAGLVTALAIPAAAGAGGQAYLSWTLGDQGGKPTVTWTITGSTKWYVGAIQIASRPDVNTKGDFPAENLVAYDVLEPSKSKGYWISTFALGPGTYYGRLTLRYDGSCQASCESRSSVRSFTIDPPPIGSLAWKVVGKDGRVAVRWTPPGHGWYVSIVLVDDDQDFSSPVDAGVWPAEPSDAGWVSQRLDPGIYYVRIRARYAECETCSWVSSPKRVRLANAAPRFRAPVRFAIARRDGKTLRHFWRAAFTVCDSTPGRLRVQIQEETWHTSGGSVRRKTATLTLAEPHGCRAYTLTRRSAWPFEKGSFIRVVLRVRDAHGAWSAGDRRFTWHVA